MLQKFLLVIAFVVVVSAQRDVNENVPELVEEPHQAGRIVPHAAESQFSAAAPAPQPIRAPVQQHFAPPQPRPVQVAAQPQRVFQAQPQVRYVAQQPQVRYVSAPQPQIHVISAPAPRVQYVQAPQFRAQPVYVGRPGYNYWRMIAIM